MGWQKCSGIRRSYLVDFATSGMALNKARVLSEQGKKAPPGQLIDAGGNPTDDPGVLFASPAGALLPFGQHKGFGLALMIELMAGILSGGETIAENHEASGSPHNNYFAMLMSPKAFCEGAQQKSAFFIDYLLQTRPQSGQTQIVYPGAPEAAARAALRQSLALPAPLWQWLIRAYAEKGINVDLRSSDVALIS